MAARNDNTVTRLDDAARGYKCFHDRQDEWTKVVLKPGMEGGATQAAEAREAEMA